MRVRNGSDPARYLRPVAGAGMLLGLLATTWSGLWLEPPRGRLALVTVLGAVPALARVCAVRRPAVWVTLLAAAAAVCALGAAVGASPLRVLTGDRPTWSALGDIIPDGLGNAAATPVPLSPERPLALSALLVLVLCGAAALVAWQAIVSRRPLTAVVATAAGLAYRWTLLPPQRPVLTGVATLVIALAVFRLAAPRPASSRSGSGRAALLGGAVTVIAVLGSAGADANPQSWWNWRDWSFGSGSGGVSAIDFRQSYGPLAHPDDPVTIARVEAARPIPLRAVTLESFDGLSFGQAAAPVPTPTADGSIRLTPETRGTDAPTGQRINLTGVRTPWVLAGGRPTAVRGIGRRSVTILDDDSVRVEPPLGPDTRYAVDTLVPDPGARSLIHAAPYADIDPKLLTILPGLGVPAVRVPVWGRGEARPDASAFGQYDGVYRLSRRIIGGARTPFEAVNRVEAFVRGSPYRYDERAPRPAGGDPDLIDFLLVTKRGYCQHFAGAMALMLRMNGIPARVAVGFTSDPGRFDPDTSSYEIRDRDAHSWVEVLFPGYGWIPFDPTPGRSVPNSASVSSPSYSSAGVDITVSPGILSAPVRPTSPPNPRRDEPLPAADAGTSSGLDAWWLVGLPAALLLVLGAPAGLKGARRMRRRRGGERAQVLGAARELEALLADSGRPIDPALSPTERADCVWRDFGIDAARIYGLASAARFAPGDPPSGCGRAAWSELARIRRTLGWRRRARAGLSVRSLRRG